MTGFWRFALVLLLAGCFGAGGDSRLCIGDGDGAGYLYRCDAHIGQIRGTEEVELDWLNDDLTTRVAVTLTVSVSAGSLNVSVLSDGEPLTMTVLAGEPNALSGVAVVNASAGARQRRITLVFEPLSDGRRERPDASGIEWQLELRAAP
ncbi:MAG: hypothetical protein HXY40_11820 [Chloroflexi bacterium]|nr:hypothetical protein [Chloroflexota bacterium]